MSDFANLLRLAQQTSQTPHFDINPAAGLGSGSLSAAYQAIQPAQTPAQPLFQPRLLPVPPPQMATFTPLADDNAPALMQPQFLPQTPAPFQGSGAGKGGPIVHGAGPSANSGSVTAALTRIGMLGG